MGLAGSGAVAIWHDLAPEGRDEFYAWHGEEHMPERLAIPGFRRGRRYQALGPGSEFFNLYEVTDTAVTTGEDYRRRLNDPTPRTRSAIRHFRAVSRSLCRVEATYGPGWGGLAATWRWDWPVQPAEALAAEHLSRLAAMAGIAGAHLLRGDVEASDVATAESRARAELIRHPAWAIMVEGWGDVEPFRETCATALSEDTLRRLGFDERAEFAVYRMQIAVLPPA